jgi:protein-S-isoprenylcysteine O-methyltransferase Ste14
MPGGAWLLSFFLPHIVRETNSMLLTMHEPIGVVLLLGGTAVFAIGAAQVYWSKLRRKGAVVSGLYRFVRHPQCVESLVPAISTSIAARRRCSGRMPTYSPSRSSPVRVSPRETYFFRTSRSW